MSRGYFPRDDAFGEAWRRQEEADLAAAREAGSSQSPSRPMGDKIAVGFPNDGLSERRLVNGHDLSLREMDWRCLTCGHWFEAASDAELFRCGESCEGKHYGDVQARPPAPLSDDAGERT